MSYEENVGEKISRLYNKIIQKKSQLALFYNYCIKYF